MICRAGSNNQPRRWLRTAGRHLGQNLIDAVERTLRHPAYGTQCISDADDHRRKTERNAGAHQPCDEWIWRPLPMDIGRCRAARCFVD